MATISPNLEKIEDAMLKFAMNRESGTPQVMRLELEEGSMEFRNITEFDVTYNHFTAFDGHWPRTSKHFDGTARVRIENRILRCEFHSEELKNIEVIKEDM